MSGGSRLRISESPVLWLAWAGACCALFAAPSPAPAADEIAMRPATRVDPNHRARYGSEWIELAQNGRFDARIIVGPRATAASHYAAKELQGHLERIVGAPIAISDQLGDEATSIVVGPGPLARSLGVDERSHPRDAFVIRHVDQDQRDVIVIAGRDDPRWQPTTPERMGTGLQPFERATLFGVYDFLERFAGVRFFSGHEFGTVVPRAKTLRIPSMDVYEAPDFVMRRVSITRGRLPLDSQQTRLARARLIHRELSTLRFETFSIPTTHGLARTGLLERFGDSHPEYFALRANGERDLEHGPNRPQLCLKNPGLRNELIRDIVSYLDGEPASARGILRPDGAGGYDVGAFAPGYVSVMPNDGLASKNFCRDELCRAWQNEAGDYSDYVWEFVNYVARRLKGYGVRGQVTNIAYAGYRRVPDIPIEDNVVVQLAVVGPWKENHPSQREDDLALAQWDAKIGGRGEMLLWNYMNSRAERAPAGTPALAPRKIASYYQRNAKHLAGAYLQSDTDYRLFHYLNYYVFHRIAWDLESDVEALLLDHHRKMFGPAARPMAAFFDRLEEIWTTKGILGYRPAARPGVVTPLLSETWGVIYDADELARLEALFDEAEALTRDSPDHRARIEYLRRNFLGEIQRARRDFYARQRKLEDLAFEPLHAGREPIVVDGRLDEPLWKRAAEVRLMLGPDASDPSTATTARAAWTTTHLLLAFEAQEPNPRRMSKRRSENRVGLIVGDPSDPTQGSTWEVWVDAAGRVSDRLGRDGGKTFRPWQSGSRGAASSAPGQWTAELEIPLKALPRGRAATGAPQLVGNLARVRALGGKRPIEEWSSWSPFVRRGLHEPEQFGVLRLVKRETKSESVIDNGGMEQLRGGSNALAAWSPVKEAAIDPSTFREGRQSLRLEASEFSRVAVRQQIAPLAPDTRYALTFFVRTEGLEQKPAEDYSGGYVNVMADRNLFYPFMRFSGSMPWTKQLFEFTTGSTAPQGKKSYVQLGLNQARGRIWFDDVRLRRVDESSGREPSGAGR